MPEQEKQKLWDAFKSGEDKAFSDLFLFYYPRLYQYGMKLVPREDLVKDTLQDIFLYIFEKRSQLSEDVNNFNVYLLTSFRRNLFRKSKQRQQEEARRKTGLRTTEPQFAVGPDDIIIREESIQQNTKVVADLLNELPARQREVLYLRYYENLNISQIAETLSINYQTVANHLQRALNRLKKSNAMNRFVKTALWFLFFIY